MVDPRVRLERIQRLQSYRVGIFGCWFVTFVIAVATQNPAAWIVSALFILVGVCFAWQVRTEVSLYQRDVLDSMPRATVAVVQVPTEEVPVASAAEVTLTTDDKATTETSNLV